MRGICSVRRKKLIACRLGVGMRIFSRLNNLSLLIPWTASLKSFDQRVSDRTRVGYRLLVHFVQRMKSARVPDLCQPDERLMCGESSFSLLNDADQYRQNALRIFGITCDELINSASAGAWLGGR